MITVRSLVPFEDAITGEHYEAGRLLKFANKDRARFMCQRSICELVHIDAPKKKAGKPCICTDIPEFRKVIKPGENGWLVDQSLQNLDIDKIFGKILKPKATAEPVPSIWEKVLEGEL